MISENSYKQAVKVIEDYKRQENSKAFEKQTYTWDEFLSFHSVSLGTPRYGDIVLTSKYGFDGGNPKEEHLFERVTVSGYCLPDEFWGDNEEGKERFFLNTSFFKIILEAKDNPNYIKP
jgi:hypothetical protein